jgi:enterochelin esterase-like enzyme
MNLEEFTLDAASKAYSRKVWYLESGSNPETLCIFLDGEYYVQQMDTPIVLTELTEQNQLPPLACLFVSHVNRKNPWKNPWEDIAVQNNSVLGQRY